MSSIFSSPKVVQLPNQNVEPYEVDNSEEVRSIEKKRKKKMGAISQLISRDNDMDAFNGGGKTTLGA